MLTLKYSRRQEEEADDLGIQYLSKAGYDPTALSDMLASLAMQTSVDAKAAGRNTQSVPEWASTHPNPVKRVARAEKNAKPYAASNVRKQNTHFAAINGMLYGDDPKQGVIEGQDFLHPEMRLKFSVPTGYGMQNSSRAVIINGNGGKGQFTTQEYKGDKKAYIDAAFKAVAGDAKVNYGSISNTTVNGIPAFYATATAAGSNGVKTDVTVFAYAFSSTKAYHFVTLYPSGTDPFNGMYKSVRKLSSQQAAAIKPRKIKVITVGRGDSISSLSAKMAYENLKSERFMALNGLRSQQPLIAGRKMKIVTY